MVDLRARLELTPFCTSSRKTFTSTSNSLPGPSQHGFAAPTLDACHWFALANGEHHKPGQQRRLHARERDHRSHCHGEQRFGHQRGVFWQRRSAGVRSDRSIQHHDRQSGSRSLRSHRRGDSRGHLRHFLRCQHHGRLALAHGEHHKPGQQRRLHGSRECDHRSHGHSEQRFVTNGVFNRIVK